MPARNSKRSRRCEHRSPEPESAEHLVSKTIPYEENWSGTAQKLWEENLLPLNRQFHGSP